MDFTHKNHLKYWIGSRLYSARSHGAETYACSVGAVDPERMANSTWLDEQTRTARLIAEDFGRDFAVFFSGGTDSEIVLRSFKKINRRPRVVFINFADDRNSEDRAQAQRVCQELNMPLEILDFDVVDFYLSGEAYEFAAELQCRQIAYLTVYHHARRLNMPAVMGGELLLRRQVYRDRDCEWYWVFRENEDASAMRFSLRYNLPLVNEWFSYTPEVMAYYLEHPTIKDLISDPWNYKLGSVSTKNSVLSDYMPELSQRVKTHGYEQLIGFNMETYDTLNRASPRRLEASLDGVLMPEFRKMLYAHD